MVKRRVEEVEEEATLSISPPCVSLNRKESRKEVKENIRYAQDEKLGNKMK